MVQGLTGLKQYLKVMHTFAYSAKNRRLGLKGMNEAFVNVSVDNKTPFASQLPIFLPSLLSRRLQSFPAAPGTSTGSWSGLLLEWQIPAKLLSEFNCQYTLRLASTLNRGAQSASVLADINLVQWSTGSRIFKGESGIEALSMTSPTALPRSTWGAQHLPLH